MQCTVQNGNELERGCGTQTLMRNNTRWGLLECVTATSPCFQTLAVHLVCGTNNAEKYLKVVVLHGCDCDV